MKNKFKLINAPSFIFFEPELTTYINNSIDNITKFFNIQ